VATGTAVVDSAEGLELRVRGVPRPVSQHDQLGVPGVADILVQPPDLWVLLDGIKPVRVRNLVRTKRSAPITFGVGRVRMSSRLDLSYRIKKVSRKCRSQLIQTTQKVVLIVRRIEHGWRFLSLLRSGF